MTIRIFPVILTGLILVGCSSQTPKARLATPEEAQAILAPLMPDVGQDQVCVTRKLNPPLERERRHEFERLDETWWQRTRAWLGSQLSPASYKENGQKWTQSDRSGRVLVLRADDAEHLESLIRQATKPDRQFSSHFLNLSNGVPACEAKEPVAREGRATPEIQLFFSQPVVVGNVALVEEGGVCGSLCGSGSLIALIRRGNSWAILARKMTWMA